MAQITITQLPQAQALDGTEAVPIVQGGVTVQTTTGAMAGAGALNYPFLTVGSTAGLTYARQIATTSGLSITDNGAGSTLQINLTGAALSLDTSPTGIQVKTGANTLTGRSIQVGAGLGITNGDGIAGDPTVSLGTVLSNVAGITGTGILATASGTFSPVTLTGVSGQISITNGTGSGGNPTFGLSSSGVVAGTYGSGSIVPVFAVDTYGRLTSVTDTAISISASQVTSGTLNIARGGTSATTANGALTNLLPNQTGYSGRVLATDGALTYWAAIGGTGTVTQINTGTGLTGGPITTVGTISIDSTVATLNGTQTFTNKSISGSTNTLTDIPNSALTNSSLTIGSTVISLGGTSLTLAGLTSVTLTQDPTADLQAATKQYVDNLVSTGLTFHSPVQAATTQSLAAQTGGTVTYNNGTAGVGATITLSVALTVLDGYTLLNTNRILVKDEVNQAYNGVYTWATGGTVLTRATDADTYGTGVNQLSQNDYFFIQNGTVNRGSSYVVTTVGTITFGTTAITFAEFSNSQVYTAGTGLTLTGTTFSITNTGVTNGSYGTASSVPTLAINAQGQITSASNTAIAINGNQITSGVVGTAYGGTALSSFTSGGALYATSTSALTSGTLPIASGGTGITAFGTGVQTALGQAVTGSGGIVLATSPTLVTPALGTPSAVVLTNATGLPLTTGVTGTLPIANGGTNSTATPTAGGAGYGTGTAHAYTAAGTSGQILQSNGASAPTWVNLSTLGVSTFSAGTTGFTPNTATSGAVTLAGTLATTNGGTGLTSFTANGVLYASSTSALATGSVLTFDGAILGVNGVSVGRGAGAVATNTAVGASALAAVTTAVRSTAVGALALANSTTGDRSTAVGRAALNGVTTGTDNTAVGSDAANNITTGGFNTVVGSGALNGNTTASNNTAVGYQAGYTNSTNNGLSMFGYQAGFYQTAGNTAIGYQSMYGASGAAGYNNTAVGQTSLYSNTNGVFNVAVGHDALRSNTTASNNTALGYQAGYTNTTGGGNTFVGRLAGYTSNADGNTAVGNAALYLTTTGASNVAIGQSALQANTTASRNTALGYQAAYSNTTGTLVVAVGAGALYSNAGTSSHVAIGNNALYSHTTSADGGSNIAIGQGAAYSNVSGQGLIAMGEGALYANTSGQANTAIGGYTGTVNAAMRFNTTGSYNTALGVGSLSANTTASFNTAVGHQAGYSSTTNGSNTSVGYKALYATTGNYNTAIGDGSGLDITTGTKNTILGRYGGNQGGLDIRTASNYIVLSDGDGNPRGIFDSSGNLLVGTASFGQPDVNAGAIGKADGAFRSHHATGTASGTIHAYFTYGGLGIGSITQNGTTGVLYNLTSDYRLKNHQQALTGAKDFIMTLKPKKWQWWDGSGEGVGFVAHEFMEVAKHSGNGEKDAVDADGKPVYQSIQPSSSEVMANLVAFVQELKAEIDNLKSQLNGA